MKRNLKKNQSRPLKPQRKLQREIYRHHQRTADLTILVDLPDSMAAESIRKSLEPETKITKGFRSRTTISSEDSQLCLRIRADDLAALRAASNSFLRFVAVGLKAVETVAPFYRGPSPSAKAKA